MSAPKLSKRAAFLRKKIIAFESEPTQFVLAGYTVVLNRSDDGEDPAWGFVVSHGGLVVAKADCLPSRPRAERHAVHAVETHRAERARRVVFSIERAFGGLDDLSNFTPAQVRALELAFALERGE